VRPPLPSGMEFTPLGNFVSSKTFNIFETEIRARASRDEICGSEEIREILEN